MLHDGGQGDGERTRELADRHARLLVEPGKESPARRVGKGGEGTIEAGGLIVNHNVN